MQSVFGSKKFIAAALSSIIMGVLVATGVDLMTASFIVAPLAAYIPVQGVVDLRGARLTVDEITAVKKLLEKSHE